MDRLRSSIEAAEIECKAHGVPITRKRLNVFSILLESQKALSAYELAASYKKIFEEPLPVITVYRVMQFLQSKDLVHKLEIANKFVACTSNDCNHKHGAKQFLICNQCLKVEELTIGQQEFDELEKLIDKAGFHLNQPQLEMNCICKTCFSKTQAMQFRGD